MSTKEIKLVRAVERSLTILEALAGEQGRPKGITEIAQKIKLGKSTIHRLLGTLQEKGYVQKDPHTEKYKLGLKFIEMGNIVLTNLELRSQAADCLKRLMERSGQTVHLAILDQGEIVYIDKVENMGGIKMASYIGRRSYVHSSALGKAILAYLPEDEVKHILEDKGMPKLTPNTITSFSQFKTHLERVRQQGYAVDDVENEDAIRSIAAPIFNYMGHVVAAVSISGTVMQVTIDRVAEMARMVVECADEISVRLGYLGKQTAATAEIPAYITSLPIRMSSNSTFNNIKTVTPELPITVAVGASLDQVVSFSGVEKGIFANYGLDIRLNFVPSGFHQINALENGEAQFGQAGVVPIALTKSKGASVIGIGFLQGAAHANKIDNDQAIVARKGSGIREQHPEDLAGKVIGVPLGTVAHEYLQAVLASKNIPEHEVQLVDLRDMELTRALEEGHVDAIVCWEAFPSYTLKKVAWSYIVQRGGGYIARYSVIFTSNKYLKKYPEIVELYLTAFCEASQWVRQHLDEAATIASRWISDLDPAVARAAIKNISFDPRISKLSFAGLKDSIDFLVKTKKIERNLKVNNLINPSTLLRVMYKRQDLFNDLPVIPKNDSLL